MCRLLIFLFAVATAVSAQATTNTITNATSVIIMPMVVTRPADVSSPTGRVETAGSIVKENGLVRQLTASGWEICPSARRLIVIQKLSASGTLSVGDGTGELVRLTDAVPTVVFTASDAISSPVWLTANGDDIDVFYSSR